MVYFDLICVLKKLINYVNKYIGTAIKKILISISIEMCDKYNFMESYVN